jgi:hypothetical protein
VAVSTDNPVQSLLCLNQSPHHRLQPSGRTGVTQINDGLGTDQGFSTNIEITHNEAPFEPRLNSVQTALKKLHSKRGSRTFYNKQT